MTSDIGEWIGTKASQLLTLGALLGLTPVTVATAAPTADVT